MKALTFWLTLFALANVVMGENITHAQTSPNFNRTPAEDSTLVGTQVSRSGNNFTITGGLNKGRTLFHSFTEFSIPTNGQANFIHPVGNQDIRDIITRVTGNNSSELNGTLNSNGANFFLINPNGVVFGPNVQLNVGRAFMATTASGINLVDGGGRVFTFGTNGNGDAPLLTVNSNVLFNPSQLIMGGGSGEISNYGTLQTTNRGQYIGLIGGNVSLNGGQINALGGRVELGGLSAPGTLGLTGEGNNIKAQLPNGVVRGDVSLTNGSKVSVAGAGGGDIAINAQNLQILGGSVVRGGIETGQGTPESVAGDIKVNATGQIVLNSKSAIANNVRSNSIGQGGNITIDTAGSLFVRNGSELQTATAGQGNAGNIKITAAGNVSFDGSQDNLPSRAISSVYSDVAVGQGGRIEINAQNLSVTNSARLESSTFGQGKAGNIKITAAAGNVSLDRSSILSIVGQKGVGKGGDIEINTRDLSLTNGAQLTTSSFGIGDSGNIKITAKMGSVSFDGGQGRGRSGVRTLLETGGDGKGGDIEIVTQNLFVTDGAGLVANTRGKGNAGNIKITATGDVQFNGRKDSFRSVAGSTVETGAEGNGGIVEINAPNLLVTNYAALTADNLGKGDAGNIVLNTSRIILDFGRVSSKSSDLKGGDIKVATKEYLLLRNNSHIDTNSASTDKDGNGGNITINSPTIVALPGNNDITANAVQGSGGRLNITSQGLFGIKYRPKGQDSLFTNDITASSTFGQDGTVNIDTPGTDPGRDSTELPNTATDASNQISQVCSASTRQNKLIYAGRGGIPENAFEPLNADVVWQDTRAAKPTTNTSQTQKPEHLPPPAVGWVLEGNGKVRLIAAGTPGFPGARIVCPK